MIRIFSASLDIIYHIQSASDIWGIENKFYRGVRDGRISKRILKKDEGFKQYVERYEQISTDEKVRQQYADGLRITLALKDYEEALEGNQREEAKEQVQKIVHNLVNQSFSAEQIAVIVDMSIDEIKEILAD
jgi:hypothetical protein